MPPKTRQRTAAQRKPKSGEGSSLTPADIIDEQEQSNEIELLRAKNQEDNRQAQNALDVGVLTSLSMAAIQIKTFISSPNPIFPILAFFQLVLCPFSLSPHWLPSAWHPYLTSESNSLTLLSVQLTVSICAVFLRYQTGVSGQYEIGEIARWVLPVLVVGAVEMQRRAEREAEAKLKLLESLKYDVKGA